MNNDSHSDRCQCGNPGCTETTNLGQSHIAPQAIDLLPEMAKYVKECAAVCRFADEDGHRLDSMPGPDASKEWPRFERVFIASPGESPAHESLWAYRLSDDGTGTLYNMPATTRFNYGDVVKLVNDNPDQLLRVVAIPRRRRRMKLEDGHEYTLLGDTYTCQVFRCPGGNGHRSHVRAIILSAVEDTICHSYRVMPDGAIRRVETNATGDGITETRTDLTLHDVEAGTA